MKILVLSNETWNDKINGNNVTSNWFEGMNAEFANIYASPGEPYNKCCQTYYQITDQMMLKSIVSKKKAGKEVLVLHEEAQQSTLSAEEEPQKLYRFLKSISGDWLRLFREILWLWGKYDTDSMKKFIDDFQPDIIFSERMASCKMLRLEKTVMGITKAPLVAFTGDDEYTLRQFKISPLFWINRFMVRRRLREMVKKYKIYYTLSYEQLQDYETRFGCDMRILQKCGSMDEEEYIPHAVNAPIRIIYAGKLYLNRWEALADISDAIKEINKEGVKMILEIYTKDTLTKQQNALLNDKTNSFVKGPVSQEELNNIYKQADIALHVESQKLSQRLATRLSFSTKIIDCLFSGCAVLAYCWGEQSGWAYLKREDAAICVESKEELNKSLRKICRNPELIDAYAKKAFECCKRNHKKELIQKNLLMDLEQVCKNNALEEAI